MFSLNFTSEYIQLILLEIQLNELDLRWSSMDFTPDFIGCQAPPVKTMKTPNKQAILNSRHDTKKMANNFRWTFDDILKNFWEHLDETQIKHAVRCHQYLLKSSSTLHQEFTSNLSNLHALLNLPFMKCIKRASKMRETCMRISWEKCVCGNIFQLNFVGKAVEASKGQSPISFLWVCSCKGPETRTCPISRNLRYSENSPKPW